MVPLGLGVKLLSRLIALELLDKELEKRNHDFVRYADDFMIIVNAKQSGERVMGSITHFIGRGSFGIAQGYQKSIELDHWIRRRLRMSYWKSWRRVRTKIRNLMRLGVKESLAVQCGASNRRYWRSSKTEGLHGCRSYWKRRGSFKQGIHIALSNGFFADLGVFSLRAS